MGKVLQMVIHPIMKHDIIEEDLHKQEDKGLEDFNYNPLKG